MAVRWAPHPSLIVWFALALSASLAGGTGARASCGDHARAVLFSIEAGTQGGDFGRVPGKFAVTPLPTDVPRPCTGPSCSRQPATPVATPAPDRPPPDLGLAATRAIPPPLLAERPAIARPRSGYVLPFVEPLDRPPRP